MLFRSNGCIRSARLSWHAICLVLVLGWVTHVCCMVDETRKALLRETQDIFYHGFDNYMKHAFPEDELKPVSCAPLTRDRENPAHIEVNDVLGNYSLTLVDSLSTLAILASSPQGKGRNPLKDFQNGIKLLVEYYGDGTDTASGEGIRARGFDLDSKVQVFETVIRGVGGLLSAHLFAIGELPITGYEPKWQVQDGERGIRWSNGLLYNGQLLRLAHDLGRRLLPAFYTPTGLPYPRVNLRHGVPFYANSPLNAGTEEGQCLKAAQAGAEITETCSAGAGSLVMEFTTLSRLTGDDRFELAAKEAFWAVWKRRSSIGLIASGIDAETGQWVAPYTGIGAGIDSFFEYAFKSYIFLSGMPYNSSMAETQAPESFLGAWRDAFQSIRRHIYRDALWQHPHYIQADLYTGALRAFWIDSLSAYFPGLLALSGEVEEAIEAHLLYTALWTRYSALPERWSTANGNIEAGLRWWGGRPEFIESTWYIYRATKDPWYLHVGEMVLRDIKRRCWTKCGWAGLQDVRTGELSDRMESFFLGETAKYLFLLFDEDHPLNTWDSSFIFTTEGHPLILPKSLRKEGEPREVRHWDEEQPDLETHTCPLPPTPLPFSISSTAARGDVFHAAHLARLHLMPTVEQLDSPLIEFSADHPSITVSDIRSPSNYTYYPWTLPLEYIPHNATSAVMYFRPTFDLSFPNLPNTFSELGAISRVNEGIVVNSMSGIRFAMVRESKSGPGPDSDEYFFRIYAVSNIALGRDEKVFVQRSMVSNFNPLDPYFTRIRDLYSTDLILDVADRSYPDASHPSDSAPDHLLNIDLDLDLDLHNIELVSPPDSLPSGSLFSSLLHSLHSILANSNPSSLPYPSSPPNRLSLTAALPTGPGAAPLPDVPDADPSTDSPLPWRHLCFLDGDGCSTRMPLDRTRDCQVVVLRRGGCSFSEKLQNIPATVPTAESVQLVVVVSYPEHEEVPSDADAGGGLAEKQKRKAGKRRKLAEEMPLVMPLLEQLQLTPGGLARPHPIPLVMVSGGEATWEMLRRSKGVGVRRRWHFESQGLRIGNLVVL
ncbi:hypothetical protein P152DRAFT_82293 [Eremomyces bilateralis CBS 781.70]|uniref:alpha-1,2-Mannosidase n=1 Tax=Eremomyces bilateralis CBS 781.70 TaxID=1392243 RepID=A0A6G1FYI0_9PEZI|nr:uncharacterized protein P152DRAFT_82293 [Eremomyces bilateralis CBS 781.70]KAF1810760.1 hypothetical protein P152DRAFT_82293 [Eremomyces bilateralis CBS 781.70]